MLSNFPHYLKLAEITPLSKNYRPVSILSKLSRIYEKIMFWQIKSMSFENVFSKYQSGFR